jgi:hypothetical protein
MEALIGLIILLLILGRDTERRVKCSVCIWRGSEKLWKSHKGCPNCRTDEKPMLFKK